MKKVLFLLGFIFLLSCETVHNSKPVVTTHTYENIVIVLDDGTELSYSNEDVRPNINVSENYEYFTLAKYDNNNKYLKVTYTRNIEFSLSNDGWLDKLQATTPYDMWIQDPDFFKVYKINANDVDIYTNEEAISDKYWYDNFDSMIYGTNNITMTLDQDYNIIDQTNEVLFAPDVIY